MKIIATIPAYNEELFLDYTISSMYDFVDEIIITDSAIEASIKCGLSHRSIDKTPEIVDKWMKKSNKIHLILSDKVSKTHGENLIPALEMAKELKGDWLFHVGADEIWPTHALKPMRNILANCQKAGILGLNVWMNYFAPDFWHCKDFRNPRLAQLTDDAIMSPAGDGLLYPKRGVYQFAGSITEPYPPGTSQKVIQVNSDYPKMLRAFHYSWVGNKRVKAKYDFYKQHSELGGSNIYAHYVEKNWDFFIKEGYKEFKGQHPQIMLSHECYGEKLF